MFYTNFGWLGLPSIGQIKLKILALTTFFLLLDDLNSIFRLL